MRGSSIGQGESLQLRMRQARPVSFQEDRFMANNPSEYSKRSKRAMSKAFDDQNLFISQKNALL